MESELAILKSSSLFQEIREDEITSILNCLQASPAVFDRDTFILRAGQPVNAIGMVLSGRVHILKEDFWGNRNILTELIPGRFFAETYACLAAERLDVHVLAAERTEVLFLNIRKLMSLCPSACDFHVRLIRNLMREMAEKNLMLTRKMEHITKRSTREKVLSYLSEQSRKARNASFEIPFNRQQLADYLSVDRSALSNELCKLRREGLLDFQKNRFTLRQE